MNSRNMRLSDAERAEVTDRLATHFADGRLDQQEYDERVSRAMSAKTRGEIDDLFDDLPGTGAPTDETRSTAYGAPGLPGPRYGHRRHGLLRAVLVVLVAIAALNIVGHAFWWFGGWFLGPFWFIALVAVVILVARHRH
jgi:hypothetical protein